jgi:hypothetical protein
MAAAPIKYKCAGGDTEKGSTQGSRGEFPIKSLAVMSTQLSRTWAMRARWQSRPDSAAADPRRLREIPQADRKTWLECDCLSGLPQSRTLERGAAAWLTLRHLLQTRQRVTLAPYFLTPTEGKILKGSPLSPNRLRGDHNSQLCVTHCCTGRQGCSRCRHFTFPLFWVSFAKFSRAC